MKEIADFAHRLGCSVVALHLGFIPHAAAGDADYDAVVAVTRDLCDHCRSHGQTLHLETGQETAAGLLQFLADVQRDNLFVNFDPANMILYGTGEPIEALQQIGPHVRSVHCKDALWAKNPALNGGRKCRWEKARSTSSGTCAHFNRSATKVRLTIEREIPQEPARQKAEIGKAADLLQRLKQSLEQDRTA